MRHPTTETVTHAASRSADAENVDAENVDAEPHEELLLDLQEGLDHPVSHYGEDDDDATRLFEAPCRGAKWIVAKTARDQRTVSTSDVHAGLLSGELRDDMLVWQSGMTGWRAIASIAALTPPRGESAPHAALNPERPRLAGPVATCQAAVTVPEPARTLPPSKARTTHPPATLSSVTLSSNPRPAAPASSARATVTVDDLALAAMTADPAPSMRVKRAVMALSALAMVGVFVTMFAISSTRANKPNGAALQRTPPARLVGAATTAGEPEQRLSANIPQPLPTASRLDPDEEALSKRPSATNDEDPRERY